MFTPLYTNWICRKLARTLNFSIAHIRRDHNTGAKRLAIHAVRSQNKLRVAVL